ncbi:MAG: bifunctional demethylmenaquinone methyltransferase/2-methoxy-6-polyprenyl-1,4-benzoquinol methylase UbiE [Bacteroidales bacterium]|nr:bifunctional demethylmenaquinone methyltransferase/2-methoxy-6-polyprenyl-1,4-benzoquinol methylase UbiE [Bacteroidales bacterium]MCF8390580.1 bifunctional demethylmenaquinone methyltransferase/2-methoxy-6-polyprenyl-1,4-benzoquinol methylase UbiE [Bacteroidales bacterium]
MEVKPFEDQSGTRKEQVRDMFNEIAGSYDFLNHFLSFNTDKSWRKKLVRRIKKEIDGNTGVAILDIATGTGDLAFALSEIPGTIVTGIDISVEMLNVARKKALSRKSQIEWTEGDSEELPYENDKFDFVTVAFGVRNFENLNKGIDEIYRVLKDSGKVYILEFSKADKGLFSTVYNFYSKTILPKLASVFTSEPRAYTYLPNSINAFPSGSEMLEEMRKSGFNELSDQKLTSGIARIYRGVKGNIE